MRHLCKTALVLGLAVLLTGPAFAQRQRGQGQGGQGQPGRGQRGGGPGGGGGIGGLLQNESVQKELKIDKAEADKLKEAVTKVQDQHKDAIAKLRDLPQNERRTKGEELNKTVNEETLKAVSGILSADQTKRLKQIELQQAGVRAFSRPDVQQALKLTDEQKDALKTIAEDVAKQQRELFQGARGQGGAGGGRGQGNAEKMTALRKESLEKIQKMLTADQKKTWKELTGEPFEIQRGQGRGQQRPQ
jgi:hypothetical protein